MKHPGLNKQIRHIVTATIEGATPAPDDLDELARSAAEIDVDVDTLREWRAEYQWWTTEEEWRRGTIDGLVGQIERAMNEPGPRHWSRWRSWRWLVSQLYAIGIVAGSCTSFDWSGSRTTVVCWTGQRSRHTGKRYAPNYVLWWPTHKWGCVLRRHHWPTNDRIAFEFCSKCIPCPDCKTAAPLNHDCVAAQ